MHTKKGIAPILWMIIVAVILGGGYAVVSGKLPARQSAGGKVETVKQETNPETKDWKTYRNEKYGFEFKYPPTYTFVADENVYPEPPQNVIVIKKGDTFPILFQPHEGTPQGLPFFSGALVVDKDGGSVEILLNLFIFGTKIFSERFGADSPEKYIQKELMEQENNPPPKFAYPPFKQKVEVQIGQNREFALRTLHTGGRFYSEFNVFVEHKGNIFQIAYNMPEYRTGKHSLNANEIFDSELMTQILPTFEFAK